MPQTSKPDTFCASCKLASVPRPLPALVLGGKATVRPSTRTHQCVGAENSVRKITCTTSLPRRGRQARPSAHAQASPLVRLLRLLAAK